MVKKIITNPIFRNKSKTVLAPFYDHTKSLSENLEREKRALDLYRDSFNFPSSPLNENPQEIFKGLHHNEVNYFKELKELKLKKINNWHMLLIDWKLEDVSIYLLFRYALRGPIPENPNHPGYYSPEEFEELRKAFEEKESIIESKNVKPEVIAEEIKRIKFSDPANLVAEEEISRNANELAKRFIRMINEPITL